MHFFNTISKKRLKTFLLASAIVGCVAGASALSDAKPVLAAGGGHNQYKAFTVLPGGTKKAKYDYYFISHKVKGEAVGGNARYWSNVSSRDGASFGYSATAKESISRTHPGVLYTGAKSGQGALTWHDYKLKKNGVPLNVLITLRGTSVDSRQQSGSPTVAFSKNKMAIHNIFFGASAFSVTLLKAKDNTPFNPGGPYPYAFQDIDEGQGVTLGSSQTTIMPEDNPAMVAGSSGIGKYSLYGTEDVRTRTQLKRGPGDPGGTTSPAEAWGYMTWRVNSNGPGFNFAYLSNGTDGFKMGSKGKGSSASIVASDRAMNRVGQYLSMPVPKGLPGVRITPSKKGPSTLGNYLKLFVPAFPKQKPPTGDNGDNFTHQKYVKKDAPSDHNNWKKNLTGMKFNPKNPKAFNFYYRFLGIVSAPGLNPDTKSGSARARAVLQHFDIRDDQINPGLSLSRKDITVYTQTYAKDKFKKVSDSKVNQIFKFTLKNKAGNPCFRVSLKKGYEDKAQPAGTKHAWNKYISWLISHRINFVVHVHGNSKLKGAFKKRVGKNQYQATLENIASFMTDDGVGKTGKAKVVITSDIKDGDLKPSETKGIKEVFRMKDGAVGDDKKVNDSDWEFGGLGYNHGAVHPGQYLTYVLHFKIKKLSVTAGKYPRYKEIDVTDKLDNHIKGANNFYADNKNLGKQYKLSNVKGSGGSQVKIKLDPKKYKKLLDMYTKSGGDLYIRYQAKLKDEKVGSDDHVDNQAQLQAKTEVAKMGTGHATKTETKTKTNADGSTGSSKVSHTISFKSFNNNKVKSEVEKLWGSVPDELEKVKREGYTKITPPKAAKWTTAGAPKVKSAKTNKVTNPYVSNQPGSTTKIYKPDQDYDETTYTKMSGGTFHIEAHLGAINADFGNVPKEVYLEDTIDQTFFDPVKESDVTVKAPNGSKVTHVGQLKVNSSSGLVRWRVTEETMKKHAKEWFGEGASTDGDFKPFVMEIKATTEHRSRQVLKKEIVKNVATTHREWDGGEPVDISRGSVTLNTDIEASSLSKRITSIHDDWTGEDKTSGDSDSGTTIMKPDDPYTVHYQIVATLGNDYNMENGGTISDKVPEHCEMVPGSVKVDVTKGKAYDEWDDAGSNGLHADETKDGFTLHFAGKQYYYTQITIDYAIKVKAEADWSDYYNNTPSIGGHPGSVTNNNGLDKVDGQSYLNIPNNASMKLDGTDMDASASFAMGAQMFSTKQMIVQDDDKWTDNLDPSHYLPHTRNDRTAVTTVLKVVMPNYLKINSVEFYNEAKSAGFDKGEIHTLRANPKLVHDESLLKNPDFTKSGYATTDPYCGEWKPNLAAGGGVGSDDVAAPKNLQDTAGKTFYHFTKWAPKTKYYKDYAKLGNMRTGFKGHVTLKAKSAGPRRYDTSSSWEGPETIDKTYDDNDVAIHLSNIYRYMTMMDDARYAQDGNSLDYRVYGEAKGLAVDKEHKTDFDKEENGQPVKAWLAQDPTNYKGAVPKDAKTLPIRAGLGQDETYDTYAIFKNVPTKDYTGHKIVHAYNSNSALTEIKGHSVMLTNDLTTGVKDYHEAAQHGQGAVDNGSKAQPYDNQTLADTRFENDISYESLKHQVINQANKLYSNPREYRIYYDFNHDYDGNDKARVFREAYELFGRDQVDGKAGYGLTESHKLDIFSYYDDHNKDRQKQADSDHAGLLNSYKTHVQSPQQIFDAGYTSNANDEYLDFTHQVVHENHKDMINGALQTSRNGNSNGQKTSVDYLIDTQIAELPLAQNREKWAKDYQGYVDKKDENKAYIGAEFEKDPTAFLVTEPEYRLTNINYRFNKRVLNNGKQAFDTGKYDKDQTNLDDNKQTVTDQRQGDRYNAYPRDNTNKPGLNWGIMNKAVDGGYRNYLKPWLKPGRYNLNYFSQSFGVGYMMNMKYTQAVQIDGHRFLSQGQNANSSQQDEINAQPAVSGKDAQKVSGQSKSESQSINDWLKKNDPNQAQTTKAAK